MPGIFSLVLGIVRGGLALATSWVEKRKQDGLLKAGEYTAIAKALTKAKEGLDEVNEAWARFNRDPDFRKRVRKSFRLNK